jgi:Asp/Glu/hydantoin racemase
MRRSVAVIHTTPVTIEPLKALIAERLDVEVINFVDDSILPQLQRSEGDLSSVARRLIQYAKFAEELGVQAVLNACSSVGPLVSELRAAVSIPVIRIDEAMAQSAVTCASDIGVAATLATTLSPTAELLQVQADLANKAIHLETRLVNEAYQCLLRGDKEGHDAVLARELRNFAQQVDIVVLAQASMARVVETLEPELQSKFLLSPRMGVEALAQAISE